MNTVIMVNLILVGLVLVVILVKFLTGTKLTIFQMEISLFLTQGGGIWLDGNEKKYRGVGISWNAFWTYLFNAIPGLLPPLILYGVLVLIFNGLGVSGDNPGRIFILKSNFFWLVALLLSLVVSSIKLSGSISVPELHAARLEVNGRGIVKSKKDNIVEFQMIREVKNLVCAWFLSLSETLVSERPLRLKSGKQKIISASKIAFMCEFNAQSISEKSGITFGGLESKTKTIEEISIDNLTSVLTDFFQNLDSLSLISMTSDEIFAIISSQKDYSKWIKERAEYFFDKENDRIKDAPEDEVERILWKFVFQRHQLIILRFSPSLKRRLNSLINDESLPKAPWYKGPKTLKEFEDQKKEAYETLEEEFLKFKEAVLSALGKLIKKDKPSGMLTKSLNQISLTFADSKAQESFEAEELQRYKILADDLKLEWLDQRLEDLKKTLPGLSEKERVDFILVAIKEVNKTIQDQNWNTTGSGKSPKAVRNV